MDNAFILRGRSSKSGLDKYASATDIYYEDRINMQVQLMSSVARHACFASWLIHLTAKQYSTDSFDQETGGLLEGNLIIMNSSLARYLNIPYTASIIRVVCCLSIIMQIYCIPSQ